MADDKDSTTLLRVQNDDKLLKSLQQPPKAEEKLEPQTKQQVTKVLQAQAIPLSDANKKPALPDEISHILKSTYGDDKNYLLAAAATIVYNNMMAVNDAIVRGWETLMQPHLPSDKKKPDDQNLKNTIENAQTSAKTALDRYDLKLDPEQEKIRQQLLTLTTQITALSTQINGNIQQVAAAQANIVNQIQQTPALQPILDILQPTPTQTGSSPAQAQPNLLPQFLINFAREDFDSRAWGKENLSKEQRHTYKQVVDSMGTEERYSLQHQCKAQYRDPMEMILNNVWQQMQMLRQYEFLNNQLKSKCNHSHIPFGAMPTEVTVLTEKLSNILGIPVYTNIRNLKDIESSLKELGHKFGFFLQPPEREIRADFSPVPK